MILEPAGGFEHSICRLQFDRSAIELHRPIEKIPSTVPLRTRGLSARLEEASEEAFRQDRGEASVSSSALPSLSEKHKIAV